MKIEIFFNKEKIQTDYLKVRDLREAKGLALDYLVGYGYTSLVPINEHILEYYPKKHRTLLKRSEWIEIEDRIWERCWNANTTEPFIQLRIDCSNLKKLRSPFYTSDYFDILMDSKKRDRSHLDIILNKNKLYTRPLFADSLFQAKRQATKWFKIILKKDSLEKKRLTYWNFAGIDGYWYRYSGSVQLRLYYYN